MDHGSKLILRGLPPAAGDDAVRTLVEKAFANTDIKATLIYLEPGKTKCVVGFVFICCAFAMMLGYVLQPVAAANCCAEAV